MIVRCWSQRLISGFELNTVIHKCSPRTLRCEALRTNVLLQLGIQQQRINLGNKCLLFSLAATVTAPFSHPRMQQLVAHSDFEIPRHAHILNGSHGNVSSELLLIQKGLEGLIVNSVASSTTVLDLHLNLFLALAGIVVLCRQCSHTTTETTTSRGILLLSKQLVVVVVLIASSQSLNATLSQLNDARAEFQNQSAHDGLTVPEQF